ncbi:MAG: ABC transporter ATP-binding protein [Rhodothermales bacterium]|nr:ABC transporter ATP-binding protein [Rhodothermales bacterium]
MPDLLTVSCLSKRFADGVLPVVNGLSFAVRDGETFALLGPSGCGKTTALRCIAGFEPADGGTVALDGRVLSGEGVHVPPEERGVGFVFQDYALFPHLPVRDNVAFGLRGLPKEARRERVAEVLKLVGLQGLSDRLPHALSGGQQQRVALARAVAPRPRLLLLDEPFSNLDALLRQEMRARVRELLKGEGMTALLVTHDQEEALSFADRVAVMQNGRIDQIGTPEEVYATPRTLFVAQFLGRTNLLLTHADGAEADTVLGRLRLHRGATGPVLLSIRPEHLALTADPAATDGLEGTVLAREYRGHDITYRVQVGSVDCLVHTGNRDDFAPGDTVWVRALEPAVVLEKAGEAPQG